MNKSLNFGSEIQFYSDKISNQNERKNQNKVEAKTRENNFFLNREQEIKIRNDALKRIVEIE